MEYSVFTAQNYNKRWNLEIIQYWNISVNFRLFDHGTKQFTINAKLGFCSKDLRS